MCAVFAQAQASALTAAALLQALRPTLFIGVPRVFDKVYAGVEERLAGAGVVSRLLFRLAVFFKQRALRRGLRWDEVCGLQRSSLRTLRVLEAVWSSEHEHTYRNQNASQAL